MARPRGLALALAATIAAAVGLSTGCACPGAAGPAPSAAAPPATTPAGGDGTRVAGQYLVTVAPGAGDAPVREAFARFGVQRVERVSTDLFLVVVSPDPGPERMDEARRRDGRLRAVQPNYVYRAH